MVYHEFADMADGPLSDALKGGGVQFLHPDHDRIKQVITG
jgi:hypothetical protein